MFSRAAASRALPARARISAGAALGLVLAGWLVAAWQMTLEFRTRAPTGLPSARSRRRVRGRRDPATLAEAEARRDRRRAQRHHSRRDDPAHGASVSPSSRRAPRSGAHARVRRDLLAPPEKFRALAPEESWLWGDLSSRARGPGSRLRTEMSTSRALRSASSCCSASSDPCYPRRLRIGLGAAVVVSVLSSRVRDVDGLQRFVTPFRLLFDFAPGWDGVRTPGKDHTSLGLALWRAPACAWSCGLCGRARTRLQSHVGAGDRRDPR